MACLNENLIVAFFAPGRSPAVAVEVDAHASSCEACRRLLAEYAKLAQQGSGLAAAPSLTPLTGEPTEPDLGVDLVQRLVHAQARKRIGTVLKGKWEIEALLGIGGMAHVFAARHRNGRRVAIKCMRPELALEPSLVERFLREGYVANKIEHPGAVAILDDDITDDGTPFLVMELLLGKTLRERVAKGPLALDDALGITAEVLDILAAAHDKGIVHRDLKPDNLFQTESGAIKVLDFGIARLKELTRPEVETRSGTTMGTIGYMPPEQARGLSAEVDARTDVWAIGATLYALLTGRTLHEASTTNEALLLAMTRPVAPMRDMLPWLPVAVQAVLDQALAFAKTDRYPSARAMKAALEEARARRGATLLYSPVPPALLSPLPPALLAPMARAASNSSVAAVGAPASASRTLPWALGLGGLVVIGVLAAVRMTSHREATSSSSVAASVATTATTAPAREASASRSLPPSPLASSVATVSEDAAVAVEAPATRSATRPAAPRPPKPSPSAEPPAHPAAPPAPLAAPAAPAALERDPLGPRH